MAIDAHCHLSDPRFEGRLEGVFSRARAAGVDRFLLGGTDSADWQRQRALRARYGGAIVPVFGLHPWWAAKLTHMEIDRELSVLRGALGDCVAVGETGLDFGNRLPPDTHERQRRTFEAQLAIAREAGKPLVLHIVRAHEAALEMLRAYAGPRFRGIVHGFSEGPSIAERYVKLGFMLSIGAAVMTSGKLARTLRTVGAEHIVVESDSPDQPPEGFRPVEGAPANEPASIRLIAAKISDLRGETVEQVLDTGRRNLIRQGLLREPE